MRTDHIDQIRKFNLDPEVKKCQCLYDSKSFLSILSVTRREMSHSAFIAELLKDGSFHGLGNYPLSLFLQTILSRSIKQGTKNLESGKPVVFQELKSAILAQTLEPSGISVQPEFSFIDADGNSGRVDILVRCKVNVEREGGKPVQALNVIIENKVYASEQDSQTEKYYRHFNALLRNKASEKVGKEAAGKESVGPRSRFNLYVYLTPLETKELEILKEPQCDCKECVQINYQDLVDGVIEPMLSHPSLSARGRFILEEYRRSLSVSFDVVEEATQNPAAHKTRKTGNGQKKIQQIILAVGKEEREQLSLLWKNHSPLLKAAINEKNNDSDEDEDENAGRQKYEYRGQPFTMGRLVEAVVSDKLGEYNYSEIESLFGSLGIKVLSKEKKTAYFENPAPLTKDGVAPYIQRNWNQKEFKLFSDVVKAQWGIEVNPFKEEHLPAEERLCLRDFYDAHENLIITTLEVVKRTTSNQMLQEEVESMLKRNIRRRDRTTFSLVSSTDGSVRNGLSWGRLVLATILDYAKNGVSSGDIMQTFALKKDCLKAWDGKDAGKTGYFIENNERVALSDGDFVVKRGWGKKDIDLFISHAKEMNYEIAEC